MMLVPHRKHIYGPLRPATGTVLLLYDVRISCKYGNDNLGLQERYERQMKGEEATWSGLEGRI
jgi:hypothetical protein